MDSERNQEHTVTTTESPKLAPVSGAYALDPSHSRIGFVARHAMVTKVRGSFTDLEGSGHFDLDNPSNSNAELVISVDSVDTGSDDRNDHLRGADFFDAETFPEIRFTSTSVEKVGGSTFRLTGDLTIKGVTKPVTVDLDFEGPALDPFGNQRVGFEGRAVVNRKDWGLTWNAALETGGLLVSEKITLEFDVSAIRSGD
jgi:polyisoprenoid-binding protein YceI